MTKKRLIKLLMGRAKLSRNTARMICEWKNRWNSGGVSNDSLYSTFSKITSFSLLPPDGISYTIHC